MPIFMDRHYSEEITAKTISLAHEKDLKIQVKHGVKFMTYWFDEARCTAFCLIDSPNKKAIQDAHDEAHGMIPHEIIEVDPSVVSAFLGRLADPPPVNKNEIPVLDAAFRAIMFTDLLDSTQMTAEHGDSKALHLLHINNAFTRNALRNHHGNEVKHTGDGIMASFTKTSDGVDASIQMQRETAAYTQKNPDLPLHLKIGLNAGEPIAEDNDLFGTVVQLAARIVDKAQADQIFISELVKGLSAGKNYKFTSQGGFEMKGFSEDISIFEVAWKEDGAEGVEAPSPPAASPAEAPPAAAAATASAAPQAAQDTPPQPAAGAEPAKDNTP